jgi:hypothetical protein
MKVIQAIEWELNDKKANFGSQIMREQISRLLSMIPTEYWKLQDNNKLDSAKDEMDSQFSTQLGSLASIQDAL